MNDENYQNLRQTIKVMADQHTDMARQRARMQRFGTALIGSSIGIILATVVIVWFSHMRLLNWVTVILAVFTLGLVIPIQCKNVRWIRAHTAAHDGMMGILNSEPRTSLRERYMEQTHAALDDLIALGGDSFADKIKQVVTGRINS